MITYHYLVFPNYGVWLENIIQVMRLYGDEFVPRKGFDVDIIGKKRTPPVIKPETGEVLEKAVVHDEWLVNVACNDVALPEELKGFEVFPETPDRVFAA